ncbi:hypothetical protein ABZW18_00360 [Streptomyces sp. NPDC004647]|uniref:hypothetical protein n=1 Tax=Streptomyces sp. NPDC004647 TaxID=3154671 RepID=UPI0033AF33B5
MPGKPTPWSGTRSFTPPSAADPRGSGNPSPWRRAKIGAIAFGVVLLFGILLSLFGGGGQSEKEPDTSAAPTSQPGGSGSSASAKKVRNGVPVAYPRTRTGAVAAAVNYQTARSSPGYFTDEALRRQVVETVMTREARAGQLKQDGQATEALLQGLGLTSNAAPQLVMRSAPMGTRLGSYSSSTATVDVWMSEIVGVPREESPMPVSGTWSTYTLLLQWQDKDWKVATISRSEGPTPLVASDSATTSTGDLRTANEEFDAPPYAG